jgi:2-methylcitrate dehydratase PrpD
VKESVTRTLLRQVVEIGARTPDDATLGAIRSLLLDHVGVAVWGSRSDVAVTMSDHVRRDLHRASGAVLPILGTGLRASAVEAAMANAVASACYEFDDTHTASSSHPGSVVLPAALAATALAGGDEHRLVAGIYAGYEVMCRVSRAANPHAHRARHFHPTSTAGYFGAAAAAAVCLGLDLDATVAAVSLSGTVAGGSMQFLPEGAITKQLHPAYAVQRGVQAALLAARGFPALDDVLGGSRGFLVAQSNDPRPERLLEGLGSAPAEVTQTGIKPYPSCRNTQSAAGALLELFSAGRHGGPVRAEDVEAITVGLIGPGLTTVWNPPERTRRPESLADAQFSMPFVAAVIATDGQLGSAQFAPHKYADPAILALMDRVECVHDATLDARYPASWPAWVEVRTTTGETLRVEVEHPRGDPANPMTQTELHAKFADLARPSLGEERSAQVVEAVAHLPRPGSLARLWTAAA